MKKILFFLLFITSVCFSQNINYLNGDIRLLKPTSSDVLYIDLENGNLVFNDYNLYNNGLSWAHRMLNSYLELNDHETFSQNQQDTILKILQSEYIDTTFGSSGSNEDTCDFILYFETTKTSTALNGYPWTKSGSSPRWVFGYNSYDIYNQVDLPSDTCKNGWVYVTSIDGWNGLSQLNVGVNNITLLPYIKDGNNLSLLFARINSIVNVKTNPNWGNITKVQMYNNSLTDFISYSGWVNLVELRLENNDLSGNIPYMPNGSTSLSYKITNNDYTSSSLTSFHVGIILFDLSYNNFSTASLDDLLSSLNTWYSSNAPTQNCTMNFSGTGMGIPTDGASNSDIIALEGIWTSQSKVLTIIINE